MQNLKNLSRFSAESVNLNPKLSIGQNIDELIFIAEASFENEYQDQIVHLPHTYVVGSD